jgi:tetratricopeptide (TPR) repeat protein
MNRIASLNLLFFFAWGALGPLLWADPSSFGPNPSSAHGKAPERKIVKFSEKEFALLRARAEAARKTDQIPEAISRTARLLEFRPDWTEGWWNLGSMYYQQGNFSQAMPAFRRFIRLESQNSIGLAFLGLAEMQVGEYAKALAHLAQARDLGISADPELSRTVQLQYGILLNRLGQFELALESLGGLAVEGDLSDLLRQAMGAATLRIAAPPDHWSVLEREMIPQFGRMAWLEANRQMGDSFQLMQQLESRYRGEPNVAYATGAVWQVQKNPEQALRCFRAELEREPRHFAALLQVGLILLNAGKPAEALPFATRAQQLRSAAFEVCYLLGRIYLSLENIPTAISWLEKAALRAPHSAPIQHALAQAYRRAHRQEAAELAQAQFLRLDAREKERIYGGASDASVAGTTRQ